MIRVVGTAKLDVNYVVDIDMTEEEFDSLSERSQNELLDSSIDWMDVCRSAEVDEFEIDEVVEISDGEA